MPNKETKEPIKQYFDIKVEALVPTILTYRIFAETEQLALEQITKKAPTGMKPNLSMKRIIKATVYFAGSSVIKLVKKYN
jgi:hypothetical protein